MLKELCWCSCAKKYVWVENIPIDRASFTIGAVLGGANKQIVEDMRQIGSYLGLSYQLQDDILDIEGNQKILGKPVGSDEINRKITLVKMIGIERARRDR